MTKVVFADGNVPVTPGTSESFVIEGTGENTGAEVGGPADRYNQVAGSFSPGDTQFVLLAAQQQDFKEGPVNEIGLVDERLGHWTISGAMANSDVSGRTVALDPLIARIVAERARGKVVESIAAQTATSVNPLADPPSP